MSRVISPITGKPYGWLRSAGLIERHGFLTPAQFRQKQLQTAAVAA
jgi:hypothetical protein